MTAYFAPVALVGTEYAVAHDVRVEVAGGRITAVTPGSDRSGLDRLGDVLVPGFANTHSHAFHRALRGRTHAPGNGGAGSFWSWRQQMYALAAVLDPDLLHLLARGTYAEMAASGISTVAEFHYLHHTVDGTPYDDPNVMGIALIEAAREVGLRITLLDTCYLAGGFGTEPEGAQVRFSDGDAARWADRVESLASSYAGVDGVVIGAAIHSVRAVPPDQLTTVAAWAADRQAPLHVHLSEQPAENTECVVATGRTPTALLRDHDVLGPQTTVVHATHLTAADVGTLGERGVRASFCPSTERDLADGVGPSSALRDAGATITFGSDSNAVIDPFEEMRLLELQERLVSGRRGTWIAQELMRAGGPAGHESLGFCDLGVLEVGRRADLVGISYDSPALAGVPATAEGVVFGASSRDVLATVVDGTPITAADPDPLRTVIAQCWSRV